VKKIIHDIKCFLGIHTYRFLSIDKFYTLGIIVIRVDNRYKCLYCGKEKIEVKRKKK